MIGSTHTKRNQRAFTPVFFGSTTTTSISSRKLSWLSTKNSHAVFNKKYRVVCYNNSFPKNVLSVILSLVISVCKVIKRFKMSIGMLRDQI